MTSRTGKFAIAVVVFIIIAIFAIPNLLSTTYVKQRIADQLSQLTGRQVALQGSSSISLRPYLGVSYDNVVISDPGDQDGKPLIAIEEFRAKLGLFAALFGDAQLAEIELVRPLFHLVIDQNGHRNWLADKGKIGNIVTGDAADETLRMGTVRIEDGILELTDHRQRKTIEFTAINGQFSWPDSNSAANTQVSAVWQGEIIKLAASVAKPVEWMRDGVTEISVKLESNPLNLSFDGMCDGTSRQLDGTLSVTTPSTKRFADWIGWQLQAPKKLGSFSISGDVKYQNNSLEFPDALVSLEQHEGKGRLQLSLQESGLFAANGTLAFNTIALPNLQNLLQSPSASGETPNKIDLSILDGLALDIRLSAESATGTPFAMRNLAAAFIVNDGRASFDIGTAEAIGGSVSGSVSLQAQDKSFAVAADIVGNNIELDQLTQVYNEEGVSLQGSGDFAIKLKSVGKDFEGLMLRLNGEGQISGSAGTLNGLDLPDLYETTLAGSDSVTRLSSGSTDYQTINLGYFIANGTAFMRDSHLITDAVDVDIQGRVDLVRTTLALRGFIANKENEPSETVKLPFFVGGTASSPLFVPLPTSIRSPQPAPLLEKPSPDQ